MAVQQQKKWIITGLVCSALGAVARPSQAGLPLTLPGPTVRKAVTNGQIAEIKKKNEKYPTFAAYRKLADLYIQLGQFSDAAQALRIQGAMYRQKGLIDAAIISETQAARYETDVRFFVDRPLTPEELQKQYTHALHEPPVGSYIGAFIDRDDQLKSTWQDENWQTHRKPEDFVRLVGKAHASYFMYVSYGQQFPSQWLQSCKKAGAIPHIAWEPKNLNAVQDDAYLRNFAQACGALNWPVFMRYASEMNGKWTPYNGNPKLYRDKFRLVSRVFKQYAPKVAMVWCVNSVPREGIPDYYPGDDACDWIGINVYSVPFYDNNPKNPAFLDNPLTLIDPIYKIFKDKKPMAICEYAASHMAAVDKVKRTDFAIEKMNILYTALPRLYPRIKMINWFSMDTMKHAAPGRQLNNYSLTDDQNVLRAYKSCINSSYYLSTSQLKGNLSYSVPFSVPRPLTLGQPVFGPTNFSVWVKSYVSKPKVYLAINDKILFANAYAGAQGVTIDTAQLPAGLQRVTAYVFDDKNRFITSASTTINVTRARRMRGGPITEPVTVSGDVERFYVDRSGLVTALELQTPGETVFVHFSPQQAKQIMDTSPIGGTGTFWVLPRSGGPSGTESIRHWNLVGIGDIQPTEGFSTPANTGDVELLEAGVPAPGTESSTFDGHLTNVITNDAGEVLALVLNGDTLVRIPHEMRRATPASTTPTDNQPLVVKDAEVQVTAQNELEREGALSTYKNRWIASALQINGHDVTSDGLPPLTPEQAKTLTAETITDATEPAIAAAVQSGLHVYRLPISEIKMRGGATPPPPTIQPLVSAGVRPW